MEDLLQLCLPDLTVEPVNLLSPKKEKYMNRIAVNAAKIKIKVTDDLDCCQYTSISDKGKWTIWDIIKNVSTKCNEIYDGHLKTMNSKHLYFKMICQKCNRNVIRTDQINFSYSRREKCQQCKHTNNITHVLPCQHVFCHNCVSDIVICPICEKKSQYNFSCRKCDSLMTYEKITNDIPQKYIDRYEHQGRSSEYHWKFYYPLEDMFIVSLVCGDDANVIINNKNFADEFTITIIKE